MSGDIAGTKTCSFHHLMVGRSDSCGSIRVTTALFVCCVFLARDSEQFPNAFGFECLDLPLHLGEQDPSFTPVQ